MQYISSLKQQITTGKEKITKCIGEEQREKIQIKKLEVVNQFHFLSSSGFVCKKILFIPRITFEIDS